MNLFLQSRKTLKRRAESKIDEFINDVGDSNDFQFRLEPDLPSEDIFLDQMANTNAFEFEINDHSEEASRRNDFHSNDHCEGKFLKVSYYITMTVVYITTHQTHTIT